MTLPASGQIAMNQVNTELSRSATAQIQLGESAVRNLAGVPSGVISMNDLHGKSAFTPAWSGATWEAIRLGSVVAGYYFQTDGTIMKTKTGAAAQYDSWGTPTLAGIGASYWIYASLSSGVTPGGSALSTWLQLSSAVYFTQTRSSQGSNTCALAITIRKDSSGGTIVASGTLNLTATYEV